MQKNVNASFRKRFLAAHIDIAITYLLLVLGACISSSSISSFLLTYLCIALVVQSYPVLTHYFFGQTLGKWVLGIKLTKESYLPINLRIAVLRNTPEILITLLSLPGVYISLTHFPSEHIPFISLNLIEVINKPELTRQIADSTIEFIKHDPFFNIKMILYTFFLYLELFSTLFNKDRLAIHDRLTRSRVIKL